MATLRVKTLFEKIIDHLPEHILNLRDVETIKTILNYQVLVKKPSKNQKFIPLIDRKKLPIYPPVPSYPAPEPPILDEPTLGYETVKSWCDQMLIKTDDPNDFISLKDLWVKFKQHHLYRATFLKHSFKEHLKQVTLFLLRPSIKGKQYSNVYVNLKWKSLPLTKL